MQIPQGAFERTIPSEPPPWDFGAGSYHEARGWRNGREAGAWAAGITLAKTGERVHVAFINEQVDGAVTSLIAASVTIRPFSSDDTTQTLELWYNG